MGIIIMPSYKDYWANDNIFKKSIRIIMNLYTNENINSFIHPEPVNLKGNDKILNSIKIIIFNLKNIKFLILMLLLMKE